MKPDISKTAVYLRQQFGRAEAADLDRLIEIETAALRKWTRKMTQARTRDQAAKAAEQGNAAAKFLYCFSELRGRVGEGRVEDLTERDLDMSWLLACGRIRAAQERHRSAAA